MKQTIFLIFAVAFTVAARAEQRDPWLWPFATTSIWNTPIGSDARFVSAGIGPAKNIGVDEELLVRVSANAPKRKLFAPKSWESRAGGTQQVGELPIDDDLTVADARKWWTPNNCAAFLLPDGRSVRHVGVLCRPEHGGPVFGYPFNPDSDLFGDGIHGSHGGSRMSALGGSIRKGELIGDAPIRHALKVDLFCERYAFYSDDCKGFRWPATSADSYAAKKYKGTNRSVVMGALLALPPSANEAALALKTAVGRKLFRTLQDFGAYVVDDAAWDCHYLCAERGVGDELEQTLGLKLGGSSGPLFDDINALFSALQVVDNNAPDRIGGGGKSRVPLAPQLAQVAPAPPKSAPPPPSPAVFKLLIKNGGMTQGVDEADEWRGKFGDVTAARDTQVFKAGPASLRVDVHGGKNGQAFQQIKGGAGAKVRIGGWTKTKGDVKAQVFVQAFAEGFKKNQFIQLRFVQGDTDWQPFDKEVELPEWTAFFNVGLMLEGEGSAWLDEVSQSGEAVDPGTPLSPEERLTKGPPPKGKPWEPGWGFYPQFPTAWQSMFKSQLADPKRGAAKVVFIGDSITQGWGGEGKAVWEKRFAPLGAKNFGIGGDSTRQVLWRIEHGLVDDLAPKLVVLKIGTNNLYDDHNAGSDEEIARGITTIVKTLREKLPTTRVLLCGILPRQNEFFTNRILKINPMLKKLDDGKTVRFLDMTEKFETAPGKVIPELFVPDQLHLATKGYEVWADAMEPLLREMMQ